MDKGTLGLRWTRCVRSEVGSARGSGRWSAASQEAGGWANPGSQPRFRPASCGDANHRGRRRQRPAPSPSPCLFGLSGCHPGMAARAFGDTSGSVSWPPSHWLTPGPPSRAGGSGRGGGSEKPRAKSRSSAAPASKVLTRLHEGLGERSCLPHLSGRWRQSEKSQSL